MAAGFGRHFGGTFLGDLSSPYHILGLKALGPLSDLIGHLIVFGEGLETICLDGRVVDEYVIPAVILRDKPESF
jgi:hypothetical protein